ncbi:hypothetical protein IMZ31_20255 (plasmid) [Pontibacillus sp. ALD_SL1]|uniref:hypothetical protein n=1 Tax=Pontibacillus sp. ALD_SL1 TaxID=2777185 RepID=UPI001A97BABB|nr:hypothetical protein [Pontibacillus sp. ALD_SL1]QST02883.1 hypothetical protein IMZ31_20255 [Pontibacillus sp. ALD_SL1]
MWSTGLIVVFLLFIPRAFRQSGIYCSVNGSFQGPFFILLSKAAWWLPLAGLAVEWKPDWFLYIVGFGGIGLVVGLLRDRSYLLYPFRTKKGEVSM